MERGARRLLAFWHTQLILYAENSWERADTTFSHLPIAARLHVADQQDAGGVDDDVDGVRTAANVRAVESEASAVGQFVLRRRCQLPPRRVLLRPAAP